MSRSTGRPSSNAPASAELLDNRYRLETLLGRGGMGVVYRARDTRLDRPVAVKVLRAAEDADEERFLAEVRILARFSHANLVRLLDAGDADGRPYLVMDLVDGETLSQRLASKGISPQQSARIGADVSRALAYVHEQGVVHRDVKPGNVLLDESGVAYLTDFGIARLIDTTGMTATGLTLGTPAYLAPEQVQGIGVGPAADVYALGLVLVECLSGRRAFEGTASELAAARLTRDVEVPSGLGDDWEQLLRSMTRRNPAARITAAQAAIEFGRLGQVVDTTLAPSIGSEQLDSTAIAATLTGEGDTAVLAATMPLPASSDVTLTSINAAPVTRGRRRRVGVWIFSALGVTAALVVGAFAADGAFSPSPGRPTSSTTSSTLPAVLATDPTTTTPSTSTTTSTTIAVPDVATAAGSLETVLQSGASDGSIASPVAQQLDLQLQPLLGASNDGNSDQQISTFDQFVQTFDQAVAAGAITSDATFANMTASINTLAEALGTTVPSTTSPATTLVPPTTSVPPGNGNGFGHGHHH